MMSEVDDDMPFSKIHEVGSRIRKKRMCNVTKASIKADCNAADFSWPLFISCPIIFGGWCWWQHVLDITFKMHSFTRTQKGKTCYHTHSKAGGSQTLTVVRTMASARRWGCSLTTTLRSLAPPLLYKGLDFVRKYCGILVYARRFEAATLEDEKFRFNF